VLPHGGAGSGDLQDHQGDAGARRRAGRVRAQHWRNCQKRTADGRAGDQVENGCRQRQPGNVAPTRQTLDKTRGDAQGEGECKTVTALFADIKGSTELMRDVDPEEARAIVDPVLQLMMAAAHRYGGYVAQSRATGFFPCSARPSRTKTIRRARFMRRWRCRRGDLAKDESFLTTLAYALQRAIQVVYEVEEQEIAVELIGDGDYRRIILWEAAEGGVGIWERLINGARLDCGSRSEGARVVPFQS
jgi:class 3 adenylate cyclase